MPGPSSSVMYLPPAHPSTMRPPVVQPPAPGYASPYMYPTHTPAVNAQPPTPGPSNVLTYVTHPHATQPPTAGPSNANMYPAHPPAARPSAARPQKAQQPTPGPSNAAPHTAPTAAQAPAPALPAPPAPIPQNGPAADGSVPCPLCGVTLPRATSECFSGHAYTKHSDWWAAARDAGSVRCPLPACPSRKPLQFSYYARHVADIHLSGKAARKAALAAEQARPAKCRWCGVLCANAMKLATHVFVAHDKRERGTDGPTNILDFRMPE